MNKFYNELKQLYKKFEKFNEEKVPLCAAETYISDFVRQGLSSDFEGKYIQGYKNRIIEKDNIGSNYIYELQKKFVMISITQNMLIHVP